MEIRKLLREFKLVAVNLVKRKVLPLHGLPASPIYAFMTYDRYVPQVELALDKTSPSSVNCSFCVPIVSDLPAFAIPKVPAFLGLERRPFIGTFVSRYCLAQCHLPQCECPL